MTTENGNVISTKRFSKDTLLYIPVFLAPALVNILLLMIFTRFFSPDIYGQYTIVINTSIIVSALLSQWITLSIQRFRPIYKKEGKVAEFNEHLLYINVLFNDRVFNYFFCDLFFSSPKYDEVPRVLLAICISDYRF